MRISEAAMKYVGVPFLHRGRTIRGIDCVGLLILSATDIGYTGYTQDAPYGREPRNKVLDGHLLRHCGPPVDRQPRVDDIVSLKHSRGGHAAHVGIITEHPQGLGIIHAYGEIGKVTYQRLNTAMRNRIVEVYECPLV